MKNQAGIIVLILICVGLCIGLIWNQQRFSEQKSAATASIGNYSNKLVETSVTLEQQRQVNTALEGDLKKQREVFNNLTNAYTEAAVNLDKTQTALKETKDEMAKQIAQRDAKISDLESQNQVLDQRAVDLNVAITNLTSQIDDTKKKLSASEGDKAFLEKELQRLITEKAELERQFNDLAVLRAQVSKLKEELSVARRLDWIRNGLFTRSEEKGGQQLIQKSAFSFTNRPPKQPAYDLNVEVSSDGTVKVIPPPTNNFPVTNPPATNVPPAQ